MASNIPQFSAAPYGPPPLKTIVKSAAKAATNDKKESSALSEIAAGVQSATASDTKLVTNAFNNTVETGKSGWNTVFGDWGSAEDEGKTNGKKSVNKGSSRVVTKPKVEDNPNFADSDDIVDEKSQISDIKALYPKEYNAARYPTEQGQPDENWVTGETAPYSLFNEWSLFKWRGIPGLTNPSLKDYNAAWLFGKSTLKSEDTGLASANLAALLDNILQDVANVPTGETVDYNQYRNPSIKLIIEEINNGSGATEAYRYNYFDFALAKYAGKISNDYMLTLRRFPMPIEDDITTVPDINGKEMSSSEPLPSIKA